MNHEQLKKYKDRDVGLVAPDIRDLLIEWNRLQAENEKLRELLIEALFDGTAIKSDDWKDRVHTALRNN